MGEMLKEPNSSLRKLDTTALRKLGQTALRKIDPAELAKLGPEALRIYEELRDGKTNILDLLAGLGIDIDGEDLPTNNHGTDKSKFNTTTQNKTKKYKHLYNPKLAMYGDEYASEYALTPIDYASDAKVIIASVFLMTTLCYLIKNYIFKPLGKTVLFKEESTAKQKKRTKEKNEGDRAELQKWNTAGWRCFSYFGMLGLGVWALKPEMHWLFNTETYCSIFKDNIIPWKIRLYYLVEISFYIFNSISIFYEPKLKDHNQMVFHHVVTLTLMFSSYYINTLRYGVAVMFLHDLADPFLELSKLLNYAKMDSAAAISFVWFMLTFIFTRCYVFPRYIVLQAHQHYNLIENVLPFAKGTMFCFISLCILHYIWAIMILKVLWKIIIKKKIKDVREDDEEDDDLQIEKKEDSMKTRQKAARIMYGKIKKRPLSS